MFDPLDPLGEPAVFTGGFSTSLGEYSVEVSAADLADTSGQTIVRALYEQLAPHAAGLGVSLVNEGDVLRVLFDHAPNGENGVYFGTSSPTDGSFGSIAVPEPASAALLAVGWLLTGVRRR